MLTHEISTINIFPDKNVKNLHVGDKYIFVVMFFQWSAVAYVIRKK